VALPNLPPMSAMGDAERGQVRWWRWLSHAIRRVRTVLLPAHCSGCGGPGPSPCLRCARRLRRAVGLPAGCTGLDACRALLLYEGPARELVARLKYRNDRRVLAWLADGIAALLEPPPGAVVTWVPTTDVRRRGRGFDQARLLAKAVARRWRVPCRELLRRRDGTPQTGRSLVQRQEGVDIVVHRGFAPAGGVPCILVDDVVTTGATLRTAAVALRATGASWIGGVAAAATPRR
jgi:predicted amidophosphoribosyltransferase